MQEGAAARRRRRFWIVAGVVILAGIAAPVGAYKVARYAPLEPGTTFRAPAGSEFTTERNVGGETILYTVRYEHGKETSFSFSVRNAGGWAVTIVDLPILHHTAHELMDVRRASVGRATDERSAVPFEPFTLKPGEERLITLHGRFSDCEWYEAGSGNRYSDILVRYRFVWSQKSVSIHLPAQIAVISPSDAACPVTRQPGVASEPATPTPTASA
jgi:hypothetical protein